MEKVYLEYDAQKLHEEMLHIYAAEGGEEIYLGDEKDILLRTMLEVLVQAAFVHETAAKNQTLRYATGHYLDLIGETRGVVRLASRPARIKARLTIVGNGLTKIPAGIRFRATIEDGAQEVYFSTEKAIAVFVSNESLEYDVELVCSVKGTLGNYETKGNTLYPVIQSAAIKAVTLEDAGGGSYAESDEEYRERIRSAAILGTTTGTKLAYEAKAKAVDANIIDTNAIRDADGAVKIYLLLADTQNGAALAKKVENALNAEKERPLTDVVKVELASEAEYALKIKYKVGEYEALETKRKINEAMQNFQTWIEGSIGISFDIYKLISALYLAGAMEVQIDPGSRIKGESEIGNVPLGAGEYWKGTIAPEEVT